MQDNIVFGYIKAWILLGLLIGALIWVYFLLIGRIKIKSDALHPLIIKFSKVVVIITAALGTTLVLPNYAKDLFLKEKPKEISGYVVQNDIAVPFFYFMNQRITLKSQKDKFNLSFSFQVIKPGVKYQIIYLPNSREVLAIREVKTRSRQSLSKN